MYYALLSGRWYRSRATDRAVQFCTHDLPDDFKRIPIDHPAGRVLASVPGTEEAERAIVANAIPRLATVKRGSIQLKVPYVGGPGFVPIPGTKLQVATNTGLDVFKTADGRYHCCASAVWFSSPGPDGPWELSDRVPEEIQAIGSTHRSFHVTFAKVYGSTKESVTFGYTPGYFGAFVNRGVVVWGTGRRHKWTNGYWREGLVNHEYWLEKLAMEHLHHWHRHLTWGQQRWYDHLSGLYRISYDAMSHAKIRAHRGQAYRTWRGNAVLAAAKRGPKAPAVEKSARVVRDRVKLYSGADGSVYKFEDNKWHRNVKGKWYRVSVKPKLASEAEAERKKKEKELKRKLAHAKRQRDIAERSSYRYRRYRHRRGRGFYRRRRLGYWGGGGVGIGFRRGTIARTITFGGW